MLRPLAVKDSHLHHTDPAHEINVFAPLSKGPGGAPILGDLFSPPDIYDNFVAQGVKKAHASWMPAMVLGFMAGCYIGLGALLADTVGGNIPGVKATNLGLQKFVFGFIGLPFGLLMVVITGADLYTSTVGCCFAAFVARKISFFVSRLGFPPLAPRCYTARSSPFPCVFTGLAARFIQRVAHQPRRVPRARRPRLRRPDARTRRRHHGRGPGQDIASLWRRLLPRHPLQLARVHGRGAGDLRQHLRRQILRRPLPHRRVRDHGACRPALGLPLVRALAWSPPLDCPCPADCRGSTTRWRTCSWCPWAWPRGPTT